MTNCVRGLFLALLLGAAARAADWPGWRGLARDGHVPAGAPAVDALPAAPKVLWHVPVGFGLASPVVAGGKVLYLDNQAEKETLHAADAATGNELWSATIDDAFKDGQSAAGPRCTPLIDQGHAYAQSCRGELQCLSMADGKVLWRTNYVKDFGAVFIGEKGSAEGARRHGNNGSPLVDDDHLIAQVGGPGAGIVCFDKLTGKVVWKSQDDIPGYAAPIVATVAGVRQVISFTAQGVIGLDRADGRLLWRVPVKTSLARHVTTPVVSGDIVAVASHTAGLIGIRVTKDGANLKAETAWTAKDSAINFSSPVVVDGHLYGVGPAKNLICVDLATGTQTWAKEGYFAGNAGKAHGGLIVTGQNILTLTDGGRLILFAADPKSFREIGSAQVVGTNWCNPALADNRLYLRDGRELWCLQL
jgi:outer membrane protein assembly factor BamB